MSSGATCRSGLPLPDVYWSSPMGSAACESGRSLETARTPAMTSLTVKDLLPEDGTKGTLVGRVWLPQANGPAVVAVRSRRRLRRHREVPDRQRPLRGGQSGQGACRDQGRAYRRSRSHCRQHGAGRARPEKALAARAGRSPDLEGCRRHLRHLDAGTRDRGAGQGQSGLGRSDPERSDTADRRRSVKAQAGLGPGDASEAGADRPERLEPISRSRHWPRCRSLHQGADPVLGRHRHGCRAASEVDLEQPRAGAGAVRLQPRQDRRRRARQRRESA